MIRNRFFTGKLLTAEDLELEQQYVREKLKRHNRNLHGFGVVSGLAVSRSSGNVVTITPGLAIDCQGNEILVEEPLRHSIPESGGEIIFLAIRYAEQAKHPVSCVQPNCDLEHSRIEETFAVVFGTKNTNQGHRHFQGRWQACGKPHGLTIGRLRRSAGQWRIERRYHPPRLG